MYSFNLNGNIVTIKEDINLLDYLREVARLTSVKNGCAEGACGTCTILIEGVARRACTLTTAKAEGQSILTVEGLPEAEREIYAWAFAKAGAVQCGFCTPGMVMSAKALLDNKRNPDLADIKKALKNNLCRCTGYIKIEKAVLLAAQALRGEAVPADYAGDGGLGESMPRIDARAKVLGSGQYVDDMGAEGMLYAAVLRPKYPRALIKSIDITAAKAFPGVKAVLTAEDVPGNRTWGMIVKDWPALIAVGEETRYVGDALALVAAVSKKTARAALALIIVEYEELLPVTSPAAALTAEAPRIHPDGNILSATEIKRGDVDKALAEAKFVVSQKYLTPPTEHAFLEPESALAVPGQEDDVTVYVSSQSVYEDRHGIASILGLPLEKVRVISKLVGGLSVVKKT